MSAAAGRARQQYRDALTNARNAAARAIVAMRAFRDVSQSPWRCAPLLAAQKLADELRWTAEDDEKRAQEGIQ